MSSLIWSSRRLLGMSCNALFAAMPIHLRSAPSTFSEGFNINNIAKYFYSTNVSVKENKNNAKQFKFIEATPDKYHEALDFVDKVFVGTEPTTRALKFSVDDSRQFYGPMVKACFANKPITSILCYNEEGQLIGSGLTRIYWMSPGKTVDVFDGLQVDEDSKLTKPVIRMRKFFNQLLQGASILSERENDRPLKFFEGTIFAVDPRYRRKGIQEKFFEITVEKAKNLGCDYWVACLIANQSQQGFIKFGFDMVKKVSHTEFTENGKVLINCDDNVTKLGMFAALKLK